MRALGHPLPMLILKKVLVTKISKTNKGKLFNTNLQRITNIAQIDSMLKPYNYSKISYRKPLPLDPFLSAKYYKRFSLLKTKKYSLEYYCIYPSCYVI